MGDGLTAPAPLREDHDLSAFHCGEDSMNEWIKRRARRVEGLSARTYVICRQAEVVGYYALNTAAVMHSGLPGALKRNMPNPVPTLLIGRLAVHKDLHGLGLGGDLLRDALLRSLEVAEIAGVRAVMVQAIDEKAVAFYRKYQFQPFPQGGMTLFLPIETLERALT